MSFLDACYKILDLMNDREPVIGPFTQKQKYDFHIPKKASNNIVIDYLVYKRCIDKEIVNCFIDLGLIFEVDKDHSVVFVGKNIFGDHKHATKGATNDN